MKIYQYIGPGKGVPGLPHRLTEDDVKRLGVEKLLADALKAKNYEIIEDKKTATEKPAVEKEPEDAGKKPAKT